jgi:hypothetical protein
LGQPLREACVVVAVGGHPPDLRDAWLAQAVAVLDEAFGQPVLVLLVVEFLHHLWVAEVLTRDDVLPADELHVQASLGLGSEEFDRSGQHDDHSVARVDGLGRDAREVRGLTALDVADDEPLGRPGLGSGRVAESLQDVGGGLVERGDRLGLPMLAAQVSLVVRPVHVASCGARGPIPGLELLGDHRRVVLVHRGYPVHQLGDLAG